MGEPVAIYFSRKVETLRRQLRAIPIGKADVINGRSVLRNGEVTFAVEGWSKGQHYIDAANRLARVRKPKWLSDYPSCHVEEAS